MAGNSPNIDVLPWARVQRLLNAGLKLAEGANTILRQGSYGELITVALTAKQNKLADEGSYFVVRSPTIGTGIATGAAVSALVDTTPFLLISNAALGIGGVPLKNIYLDYIRLTTTVAGTNGTNLLYATKIDNQLRYSSGGAGASGTGLTTVLAGPYPTNAQIQAQSMALVYAGAITSVGSTGNAKTIANGPIRTAIPVVGDQYVFQFGACAQSLDGTLVSGAAVAQRNIPHPPVILSPQSTFALYLWSASQTVAANYEVEIGYIER